MHKTSRLCNRHFDDSDILKVYNILGVFHPFKYWSLSAEVGVEQPKAKKRALRDVTNTNLPAFTLQILENIPLTVNQPPIKRSRVRKLHTTERRRVQQRLDHVAQELIQHTSC
ncbi:hypothetical protein OUZ56_010571 [Daphnia magna]|uniref:THAP-type domain-containing protein n=1 Tax=Daphnia magna TaxID=35525 RepID=A0ABR0AIW4_9CRUS|nr:hypothetical protein OUZ56_010571 [Daphnia magna]